MNISNYNFANYERCFNGIGIQMCDSEGNLKDLDILLIEILKAFKAMNESLKEYYKPNTEAYREAKRHNEIMEIHVLQTYSYYKNEIMEGDK